MAPAGTIYRPTLRLAAKEGRGASASDLLTAALAYAGRGWPVLPLRGKAPRVRHGVHDATCDAKQIRAWWEQWPDAAIGVRAGAVSGLLIVDVDEGAAPRLPATYEVLTPRGGRHLYLQHPGGYIPSSVGTLAPGVDIRCESGYVVAPPSPGYVTVEREIAPAPAWLAERLRTSPRAAQASAEPARSVEPPRTPALRVVQRRGGPALVIG